MNIGRRSPYPGTRLTSCSTQTTPLHASRPHCQRAGIPGEGEDLTIRQYRCRCRLGSCVCWGVACRRVETRRQWKNKMWRDGNSTCGEDNTSDELHCCTVAPDDKSEPLSRGFGLDAAPRVVKSGQRTPGPEVRETATGSLAGRQAAVVNWGSVTQLAAKPR